MAGYRQGRRFGARDEGEFDLESAISALKDDPDADAGDVLAAVIADCDPDQIVELTGALRDIVASLERGGDLARWSEDRRFTRDQRVKMSRDRARLGRDVPPAFEGRPNPGGADSDGSRPGFRDDLAPHSDLMSLGVPR